MTRLDVVVAAAKQVGRPLFFSLLIITVSFLPVFALEAQSGRLFKPLAYTKTFAIFFAALLSVSIVPILMLWFIRGEIRAENRNPASRLLAWAYRPMVNLVLRFKWLTLLLALAVLVITWIPLSRIGSEFMPPLNEGSLLFMPTSVPGISITEAKSILQKQDALIAGFPEVEHAFGKIGRARTATDSAPLFMTETVVTFKPEDQWRPGMTLEKIRDELGKLVRTPGAPAIWWMPVRSDSNCAWTCPACRCRPPPNWSRAKAPESSTAPSSPMLLDSAIADALKTAFILHPRIHPADTSIEVSNGVVIILGTVDHLKAHREASRLAGEISGVIRVYNLLKIVPGRAPDDDAIRDTVESHLETNPLAENAEITVNVIGGVVQLTGTVGTQQEKWAATDATSVVRGVVEIRNRLKVLRPRRFTRPTGD